MQALPSLQLVDAEDFLLAYPEARDLFATAGIRLLGLSQPITTGNLKANADQPKAADRIQTLEDDWGQAYKHLNWTNPSLATLWRRFVEYIRKTEPWIKVLQNDNTTTLVVSGLGRVGIKPFSRTNVLKIYTKRADAPPPFELGSPEDFDRAMAWVRELPRRPYWERGSW